jgi:hypothetical protein
MVEFGAALSAASNDWELTAVMEEFMDVEKAGAYWAVDRALDLEDGPAHYRSRNGGYFAHNFCKDNTSHICTSNPAESC